MRITIELEPGDVRRFLKTLERSRRIAREADEPDILAAAKQALNTLLIGNAPEYVRKRMVGVQRLIMMLEDDAWALPHPERVDVLEALVYFSDPEDLIPDEVEVIGLLDDAIVVELLLRRQRHVLQAYQDFCEYRSAMVETGPETRHLNAARLARRREMLMARMRRRRARTPATSTRTRAGA
jgi:uncharacterized membrane protein YkvA (DUF1232 family)